jgi:DNA-binding transcriptional ArsR family regulator
LSKRKDPFDALAHPIRRAILDLLRDQPGLSAGDIAAYFPEISRPAVSKHLAILRAARLVRARARGREMHYTVDPGPLREMYQEWLERFAPLWEQSLANLKRRVEEGNPPPGR